MSGFVSWVVRTAYPYPPFVVMIAVLWAGYSWPRAVGAFVLTAVIFLSAGWVQYRRTEPTDDRVSGSRSRAVSVAEWPTEAVMRREGFVAGVRPRERRPHVMVFAPGADGVWWVAEEPARSLRGMPKVVSFAAFDAMVADLTTSGVRRIPPSPYARKVVRSLRERLAARGVNGGSLAAGMHEVEHRSTLVIGGGLSVGGPRFAEFRGRVPTRAEAELIIDGGWGVALHRVPRADRDLRFLEWLPNLRGLWISGRVEPARVAALTELRQLSLLSTGDDVVDLSGLTRLEMYEGTLRGRESVLQLPLTQLYLERVDQGDLHRIPPSLEVLSLSGARELISLDAIADAANLRELRIEGARTVDVRAVSALRSLRTLTLVDVEQLTGASVLAESPYLRELNLISVGSLGATDLIDLLRRRGVDLTVTP